MQNVYFEKYDWPNGSNRIRRHIVEEIGLRKSGDHAIPDGFELMALCGRRSDGETFMFGERCSMPEDGSWESCPECERLQRERLERVADKLVNAMLRRSVGAHLKGDIVDALTELFK